MPTPCRRKAAGGARLAGVLGDAADQGDAAAASQLLPLVFEELRRSRIRTSPYP